MTRVPALILAVSLAVLTASPVRAQDANAATAVQFGAITFAFYCTICHGSGATGDGSVAGSLRVSPVDLTQLARANDGEFPEERVRAVIDGREEVVGHLEVAMPPWGRLFSYELREFEEGAIREAIIARRIDHLVAYLKSIQQ